MSSGFRSLQVIRASIGFTDFSKPIFGDECFTVEDIIVIRQGNRDWELQLSLFTLVVVLFGKWISFFGGKLKYTRT